MHKLFKINVLLILKVKDIKQSLSNDSWQSRVLKFFSLSLFSYLYQCNSVDAFAFVVWVGNQITENILEVWDCNVLFKFLVLDNQVFCKFDLSGQLRQSITNFVSRLHKNYLFN
jgi:hypothetical protein